MRGALLLDRTLVLALAVLVITGVVLLILRHPKIGELFARHLPTRSQKRLFLAAVAFFLTFTVARSLAYANYHQIGPFHDIYIRGRHIHHLVWGILLLLAVGYGWLMDIGTPGVSSVLAARLMALLYGAGAALTLDEFALWLNLRDVYWTRQGRASIDAVVLFGMLLLIGILGRNFFRAIGHEALVLLRRGKQ
jgi:hypothetical protein